MWKWILTRVRLYGSVLAVYAGLLLIVGIIANVGSQDRSDRKTIPIVVIPK